jgi:hypothetical protein
MNSINSLVNCFTINNSLNIKENINEVCVIVNVQTLLIPGQEAIEEILKDFKTRDKITIDIIFEDTEPVTMYSNGNVNEFLYHLESMSRLMDEESKILLKITVRKNLDHNQVISVYFLNEFTNYLSGLTLLGSLYTFNTIFINEITHINFDIMDQEVEDTNFGTNTFKFSSNGHFSEHQIINRKRLLDGRNSIGNFSNASNYSFIPEDFYLLTRSNNSDINSFFDKLCTIYSMIFIADFSNIANDHELYFKINGYKMFDGIIKYSNSTLDDIKILYEIYKWIYEGGNLSDKVGLARNIISLQIVLDEDEINLNENSLKSIKSGYEIYLKENVSQYIEVKNQVSQFLIDLSIRTSDLVNNLANGLKNNHFIFLTFFISVFVFNALSSGKLSNIFTKDITYISYGLLIISFFYLIGSIIQTIIEENRFITQYIRLKKMYEDILDTEDLKVIFKNDDHQEDLRFIRQKATVYAFVWLLEIIILYNVVFYLKI